MITRVILSLVLWFWPLLVSAAQQQYWIIGINTGEVWSLQDAAYESISNTTYQAWLGAGNSPAHIGTAHELYDVIAAAYPSHLAASASGLDALGLNPNQAIQWRVAAGITITSSGTSSLNGIYAVNDLWLNGLVSGALVRCGSTALSSCTNGFPNSASTYTYVGQDGTAHTMTPGQMQNIVLAIQNYFAALYAQEQVAVNGGTPSWPVATATIP